MTALLNMPRAAWKQQPSAFLKLNTAFGDSILCAMVSNGTCFYDAAGKLPPSVGYVPAVIGGTRCSYFNNVGKVIAPSTNANFNLAASELTLFCLASYNTLVGSYGDYLLGSGNSGSSESQGVMGIMLNSTVRYSHASQQFDTTQTMPKNVFVPLFAVRSGSSGNWNICIYINRVLALNTTTSNNPATTQSGFGLGQYGDSDGYDLGFTGHIAIGAAWKKALSNNEVIAISENPWQLFAPATSRFYLIPSSGGVLTLTIQKAIHSHSTESPTLSQAYALTLAAAAHAHHADNVALTQAHSLSVAESTHGHSVEAPTLTLAGSLIVAEANHSHSVDAPSLTQAHTITLQDAAHSQGVDAPILTQAHNLVAADSMHSQTVEVLTLFQANTLSAADGLHSQFSEALTLEISGMLAVQETAHSQSSEMPTLFQANTLTLADALQAQTSEAPTLSSGPTLTVQDTQHQHLFSGNDPDDALQEDGDALLTEAGDPLAWEESSLALSQGYTLTLADAVHAQTVEPLVLTQAHLLAVQDALHTQTAETISLGSSVNLVVADSTHAQSSETPTLALAFVLTVLDALQGQSAESVLLSTQVTLIVSDALHAQLAGSAAELTFPTGDRVFVVANEDRLVLVAAEDRVFAASSIDRLFGV